MLGARRRRRHAPPATMPIALDPNLVPLRVREAQALRPVVLVRLRQGAHVLARDRSRRRKRASERARESKAAVNEQTHDSLPQPSPILEPASLPACRSRTARHGTTESTEITSGPGTTARSAFFVI